MFAAWRPEYTLGLAPLAAQCAAYLTEARAIRASVNLTPEVRMELEAGLQKTRRLTREGLVEFQAIPGYRVPFPALNADGVDAEIAALCAPIDPT